MKRATVFILFFAIGLYAKPQSVEQIKADSKTFIWGEGTGASLNKADQEALQQIITQISAQVESSFTLLKDEVTKAGKSNFSEEARLVMNTYSNATLHNTERIVLGNEPDAKVFRYIRRTEVTKVFEQRKRKIIDFTSSAENFAARAQLADALKYYNWALALLRSHPEGGSIEFPDSKGQNRLLVGYLPARINDVLASVNFRVTEIKDENAQRTVVLGITSGGKPVTNFDYSYWDGRDWSSLVGAKDGIGFLEFFGDNALQRTETQIRAECTFEGEARIDRELEEVLQRVGTVPFRSAYFNIKLIAQSAPNMVNSNVAQVANSATGTTRFADLKLTPVSEPKIFEDKVDKIIASIQSRNTLPVKSLFTPEGFETFNTLLGYGQTKILQNNGYKTLQFGDGVVCRGPKMSFAFKTNNRRFVEDVVFHFDKQGKVNAVAFGLDESALNTIAGNTNWSEAERFTIISFLEHYKTAYALKRLDYISSIFADDALIIVGNVVKVNKSAENPFQSSSIIKYNRYDKQKYLKNLEHCFASNEFINIKFEDSNIRKAGQNGGKYGIQIKQNYYSSNYGDQGYLFLLVDFENPAEPTIHVRTWQPEKNPDGSVYGVEDF